MNYYIPYHHFKKEGLMNVKNILRKGDFICKLDLQNAYFAITLSPKSRKYVRFRKGNLYGFLCLDFLPTCGEDGKTERFVSGNIEFAAVHPQGNV